MGSMILFLIGSALCLFGALFVVVSKSPLRGVGGLWAVALGMAVLFLRLDASLLALLQFIGGTVFILIVFGLMVVYWGSQARLNSAETGPHLAQAIFSSLVLIALGVAAIAFFISGTWHALPQTPETNALSEIESTKEVTP